MPEDKFVQLNGMQLHYRDILGAKKPALLFMHGLTGNAYCFDHVAPEFVSTHPSSISATSRSFLIR